jgi:cell wall-associated NlpC family hydrolase
MNSHKTDYFNVNVSVINLYSEPNFRSEIITQALLGESCSIIDRKDTWIKIKQWDGYESWANSFYGVESKQPYNGSNLVMDNTGIILDPEMERTIRTIVFGDRLQTIADSDLGNIILPDGQKGKTFAHLRSLKCQPTRSGIIKIAMQFIGAPYAWGGKSPYGFDCSGFVQTIFHAVGIKLPRDAADQAEFLKQEAVDYSTVQPGDLLFFKVGESIDHVAITIEKDKYIHARGYVRISNFNKANEDFIELLGKHLELCISINHWVES